MKILREIWWVLRQPYYFIHRGIYGWATPDWWNLDVHISGIMIGALKEMETKGHHVLHHTKVLRAIRRMFSLHIQMLEDCRELTEKEKREYKLGQILLQRNFGRLWD